MSTDVILLGVGLLVGGAVVWWLTRRVQGARNGTDEQLTKIQNQMSQNLNTVMEQVDRRLAQNVQAMNESKSFLASRVSDTERTVREVSSGLGRLTQATSALQKSTEDISSFQQLLKSPKVRGSFGEVMLNNLLADVLPADRFEVQSRFGSTGEIADAVIKLQDGYVVAVDAKFPLANYETQMKQEDPLARKKARAALMRDIKKHVVDISRKYIVPADRTLDYAFMYIPVEGVYYETMVSNPDGDSLWDFCLEYKVVPVSPNSFLAYLHTVLVGLRGMKIQEQTKEILESLGQTRRDFKQFADEFTKVGQHLTNAKNRFDDSARRLDKFGNRLDQIEDGAVVDPLEGEASSAKGETEQLEEKVEITS